MDLNPADTPAPPTSRMTLLDLMGLVVACAGWLAGWVFFRQPMRFLPNGPGRGWVEQNLIPSRLFEWLQLGSLLAVTLAATLLIRGPSHSWRRPPTLGSVACLAVLLSVAMDMIAVAVSLLLENLLNVARRNPLERFDFLFTFMGRLVDSANDRWPIGKMILISWLVQTSCMGWRWSSSWLDRLGRAIGSYYLLALSVELVVEFWTVLRK